MNSSKRPPNSVLNFFSKVPKKTENSDIKDAKPDQEVTKGSVNVNHIVPSTSPFVPNEMDIGLFTGIFLDNSQKLKVLENSWKPDPSFSFPANDKRRKFQYRWLEKYPWLSYSAKFDGAFCKVCVAFSNGEGGQGKQRLGKLVLSPLRQWKDALEIFASHHSCQYHKNCSLQSEEFRKVMKGQQKNIGIQLHSQRNAEIDKNRQKLHSVIKTVILCGRQGLPLRGHRDYGNISLEETAENEGNFRALIRFRAESGDENLKDDVRLGVISKKYTSPDIQNEIIEICGQIIQNQIVEKINKAKCFTVLADESTDISGKEILTLCARYVDESNPSCVIKEDFLDFIEVENLSGASIAQVILSNLRKLGIDVSYLRGQGYDGAASMSGKLNGVQAKVRENHPTALYVHCCNHALNLVLSKSCSIPSIRNSLALVQEIVTFFRASAKRRRILKNQLQIYFSKVKDKSKKIIGLKNFCETRWVERHEALFTFCECLEPIILAVQEIQEDRNSDSETSRKAMLFFNSLCQGNFLISLFVAEKCFAVTYNLSTVLQKSDNDLISSYNAIQEVIEMFKKMREASEVKFSEIFKRASDMAKELDIEIKKTRLAKKQMYRANTPSESPEDYYRKTVFIPFLDFLVQNMVDRFENHKNIISNLHGILPQNVETSSIENIMQCAQFYSSDINVLPNILKGEIEMWFQKWSLTDIKDRPTSAIESLAKCDASIYPNVKKLLKILSTLPISTATPERTFSTLRRLKTYLRSTMTNSRLSGLALLNIHRELNVDSKLILNTIAAKRSYLVL